MPDETQNLFPLPADPDAYDVVQAFAAQQDARPDDHALLRQWTARFPQFADDLIAFGYAHAALGWSLTDPIEDEAADTAKAPITDLLAEARAQGLSAAQFTQTLRLDKPLLATLNQRLLDAATMPRALAAQIAATLGRSVEDVISYLRQPPRLAAGAHYKARKAPSLVAEARPQRTFADALQSGNTLSEEERAYWRAEIEKGEVLGHE